MPNLALVPKRGLSSFRRMAIGTWRTAKDPSVYGSIALEADAVLDYIARFREATGRHLTLTHVMARAMGLVLAEMPDANAILRYNRIYLRDEIAVFFQVAMQDPKTGQIDLSGVTVRRPEQKDMLTIVDEFEAVAAKVRAGRDTEKEQTRGLFKRLPALTLGLVLDLLGTLLYTLNLDLRWAGVPKDAFGSVMVTNIGSLGLEAAYVPLVPYSRVPLLVAMGAVKREPVLDDADQVRPASILRLYATFDHRILDGVHAAKMAKALQAIFADPEAHLGAIPGAAGSADRPPG